MSDASLADCKRCGRAVHEDHSHAGCEPPTKDKPDLGEDKIRSAEA
jgi:hypothetical protein